VHSRGWQSISLGSGDRAMKYAFVVTNTMVSIVAFLAWAQTGDPWLLLFFGLFVLLDVGWLALPSPTASRSRPGGQRGDERTENGRP
jgi:hypothetical protein